MTNKFKVGDRVKVKMGLTYGLYEGLNFADSMEDHCGHEYTIENINDDGRYVLDGVNTLVWNDAMLEPVTKNKSIIINDYIGTQLETYPKLLLKLNYEFKKMGFKKVFVNTPQINLEDYHKELTLLIGAKLNGFNSMYCSNGSFDYMKPLERVLETKKGWLNGNGKWMYSLHNTSDKDRTPIIVKLKNKGSKEITSFEIGTYLKTRNMVLLYYPLFATDVSLGLEDDCFLFFVNELKTWLKTNKIQRVDTSKIVENIAIEKLLSGFKKRIADKKARLTDNNSNIKSYSESIINMSKENLMINNEIESGEKFILNMNEEIHNKIEEIKKLPIVEKVEIVPNGLKIKYRGIIKVKVNKWHEYPLGEFTLLIKDSGLEITNKTPARADYKGDGGIVYHSPHVYNEGSTNHVCFGTGKEKVNELLGNFKYKELTLFVYLFLKSYNPNDRYCKMERFIAYREKRNEDEIRAELERNPNEKIAIAPATVIKPLGQNELISPVLNSGVTA